MTSGDDRAFGRQWKNRNGKDCGYGLTKREYFAAMAMQGLRANVTEDVIELAVQTKIPMEAIIAKCAVQHADALIKELNKNE